MGVGVGSGVFVGVGLGDGADVGVAVATGGVAVAVARATVEKLVRAVAKAAIVPRPTNAAIPTTWAKNQRPCPAESGRGLSFLGERCPATRRARLGGDAY